MILCAGQNQSLMGHGATRDKSVCILPVQLDPCHQRQWTEAETAWVSGACSNSAQAAMESKEAPKHELIIQIPICKQTTQDTEPTTTSSNKHQSKSLRVWVQQSHMGLLSWRPMHAKLPLALWMTSLERDEAVLIKE